MPVADRCDRCGRCEAVTAQIWLLRSDDAAVDSSNPSMCVALVMLRFASIDAIGSLSANHWKLVARSCCSLRYSLTASCSPSVA